MVDVVNVEKAIGQNPDVIVIGKGEMGAVKAVQECENFIEQKSVELIIDNAREAVETFNIILEKSKKRRKAGKGEKYELNKKPPQRRFFII